MRISDLQCRASRQAFTMIEMIVVVGITLVLATLVVAVVGSPILVQDKARRGGDKTQSMLRIAKSFAVASRSPCGVRLVSDSDGYVRQLQYIEQPSDFVVMLPGNPPQARRLFISPAGNGTATAQLDQNPPNLNPPPSPGQYDFTSGLGMSPSDVSNWPVQAGDYLELQGGGLLHLITGVGPGTLTLLSTPTNADANIAITQWRVLRQPRVLKGETPLLLPQDVVIDTSLSLPPGPTGTPDILFAPSGRVLGRLGAQDRIVLFVRDITRDSPYQNNPVLVSIHARTGFIAVHPVDTSNPGTSDYNFTLDGRLSGL